MLVYGDRSQTVDPRVFGEALVARCAGLAASLPDLQRHERTVSLLIDVGKLTQGLADSIFDREGLDDVGYEFGPIASLQLAFDVHASWRGWAARTGRVPNGLSYLLEDDLPDAVTLREPEGYAFYAVYPELHLVAAEEAQADSVSTIVGLRSIGTSLGGAAACGAGGFPPITLRPFGDPFARGVALTEALRARLTRRVNRRVIVVDEGPGASGSSFGAVGDLLEEVGIPPARITYMPSHAGDLGPQASERHRARWRTANKAQARFEDVILPRLPGWIEPLIGPLICPLRDLSGGLWRGLAGEAPAWPQQERRKYLATTGEGRYLMKFAGLAEVGPRKLERARALHAAGFTPEPLGLAHGFLVERWIEGRPVTPGDADNETLGRYLAFRASTLTPPRGAASDEELRTMMRRNLTLAGLTHLCDLAERLPAGERGPPCAIDGRLHAWEWRRGQDGRLVKLDALDHCEAHDLICAQDVAWDVAGAGVEFDLGPAALERLRRVVEGEAGTPLDPGRVTFQTAAYLAFQIGWWTLAANGGGHASAADQACRYLDRARAWRPEP